MEYKRLFLTYPQSGKTIHKTKSLNRGIKKCYEEFKEFNDIGEGFFIVTDLNDNYEYKFKVKNSKIYRVNKQQGGAIPIPPTQDSSTFKHIIPDLSTKFSDIIKQTPTQTKDPINYFEPIEIKDPINYFEPIELKKEINPANTKFNVTITPNISSTKQNISSVNNKQSVICSQIKRSVSNLSLEHDKDYREVMKRLDQLGRKIEKVDSKLDKINEDKINGTDEWCIFM